ncbi:hypothetical protein [Flagellimonas sp.]|uniref:hypothetical protein n=1 Tax=Flagellimonas sp. TaxID=2058762 RepID=UPI003BAD933D
MRLKTKVAFLVSCSLLILFVSCKPSKKSDNKAFSTEETLAELDGLLSRLHQIDNTDCKNLDEIVTINERMRRIVENVRTNERFEGLIKSFDKTVHQISFIFSGDKQFAVFSWQTKMDCLGNSIKNIALYKYEDKVKASSLYGNPMVYHRIKSNKQDKNKTLYILEGSYLTEKDLNDLVQSGYKITNGYLAESQIPETEQAYVDNTSL